MGKEENAGYKHFRLFPQCFQKAFPPVPQKSSLRGYGLRRSPLELLSVAILLE